MKIMSCNIRGGGSSIKHRIMKEIVCNENLDMVLLQEVNKMAVDRSFIGSIWRSRFKEWLFLPSVGSSGGLLLVWDTRSVKVVSS